jgi:hypothetical protein
MKIIKIQAMNLMPGDRLISAGQRVWRGGRILRDVQDDIAGRRFRVRCSVKGGLPIFFTDPKQMVTVERP